MISTLQQQRYSYQPKVPDIFTRGLHRLQVVESETTSAYSNIEEIKTLFPNSFGRPTIEFISGSTILPSPVLRVGIVLSGGQAPGGHSLIAGLFDGLKQGNPESRLFGFIGGPIGILHNELKELTANMIDFYRNTGGFDLIGSDRTKIESQKDFAVALDVCRQNQLNALVIVGGDDSNTNVALLAEYFMQQNSDIIVTGCPKTIDGDLKNSHIEVSFGFDTATKTYSEIIGNISRDVLSSKKYWHFIRLMGRSASHITLECSLRCEPDIALISEEIEKTQISLKDLISSMVETIVRRAISGKPYGIVLLPEGVVEYLPGLRQLLLQLNEILPKNLSEDESEILSQLSDNAREIFLSLPPSIRQQLLVERDPHGNVQVSRIETERLFIHLISKLLKTKYPDVRFEAITHFLGYEGRCGFPSNFDTNYAYNLGLTSYLLILHQKSGYIAWIQNLDRSLKDWSPGGGPITMMMNMERRSGENKPVIKKELVDLEGKAFQRFSHYRNTWVEEDTYIFPGPIQYFGPPEICDTAPLTLLLEKGMYIPSPYPSFQK